MIRRFIGLRFRNAAQKAGYNYIEDILPVVEWVYQNRKKLALAEKDTEENPYFDYPDYCGMPKAISKKMTSDMCDLIKDNLSAFQTFTLRETMRFFLRAD